MWTGVRGSGEAVAGCAWGWVVRGLEVSETDTDTGTGFIVKTTDPYTRRERLRKYINLSISVQ